MVRRIETILDNDRLSAHVGPAETINSYWPISWSDRMQINSDRLKTFHQLAMDRNYHKAAENLCLTQSAVSQRIIKLEQEIGEQLIIRHSKGISLTEAGKILFDHACNQLQQESDTLAAISGQENNPGSLRVAAYSSVLRSVVIPALSPLIQDFSDSHVEFFSREMKDLPPMLKNGEADFMVLDYSLDVSEFQRHFLGEETLVHIRNRLDRNGDSPYLDHDSDDMTTYHFFLHQQQDSRPFRRCYYDDIYGIIDGVRMGIGQAIVSRHLIEGMEEIEIQPQRFTTRNPVYLYHNRNRYLSRLQQQAVEILERDCREYL